MCQECEKEGRFRWKSLKNSSAKTLRARESWLISLESWLKALQHRISRTKRWPCWDRLFLEKHWHVREKIRHFRFKHREALEVYGCHNSRRYLWDPSICMRDVIPIGVVQRPWRSICIPQTPLFNIFPCWWMEGTCPLHSWASIECSYGYVVTQRISCT